MKSPLFFLIISTILIGCSTVKDVADSARMTDYNRVIDEKDLNYEETLSAVALKR
jgi:hypothetical protein